LIALLQLEKSLDELAEAARPAAALSARPGTHVLSAAVNVIVTSSIVTLQKTFSQV
jgi:hypothetical protein